MNRKRERAGNLLRMYSTGSVSSLLAVVEALREREGLVPVPRGMGGVHDVPDPLPQRSLDTGPGDLDNAGHDSRSK